MLYNFIQGNLNLIIETNVPNNSQDVLHGILVGICDGGIDNNFDPTYTRITPRNFYAVGPYTLIEISGELKKSM